MFRTPISLEPVKHPITMRSNILSIGSCFADFIGNGLGKNKFQIATNPFGIIFHPLAQFRVLELALMDEHPAESTYVKSQGIWYNYRFHSSISDTSLIELEKLVHRQLGQLKSLLAELDFLLLTFGTALQYKLRETDQLVANCHKVPQSQFEKSLTTPEQIVLAFQDLSSKWGDLKPKVILSVSPIRHIKEGIERNSVSKSVLRVACEQIIGENHETMYFPGFEIMMDDLRDYRFFEKDMIHPNETAREYIWDMFITNYLDDSSRDFIAKWHKISLNMAHRPFHPHSPAHQEFINNTLKLMEELPEGIDTTKEIALLKEALND